MPRTAALLLLSGVAACQPFEGTVETGPAATEPGPGSPDASPGDPPDAGPATPTDASIAPPITPPPGCDLAKGPKESPACVTDAVAVFVSPSGVAGGPGTKAAPTTSLARALELAVSRRLPRVYVCEGTYDVAVDIVAPVSIYGGLACSWTPTNAKTKLAPAKGIPLRVTKVSGAVLVEDIDVLGSADPSVPGSSAIAAFVSESTNVTFRRTNLSAGAATAGAVGASRSNYAGGSAQNGRIGPVNGGDKIACDCVDNTRSVGGTGDNAADDMGSGATGYARPLVGGDNSGASGFATCAAGRTGANGLAGAAGVASAGPGMLSAGGWVGTALGLRGGNGDPAQGGGGGGGMQNGQRGGGGGACGGCGGGGGDPGKNGGSSFALLSFNSTVTVTGGVLSSGPAGRGGAGAAGQVGQAGGIGGPSADPIGCAGGAGGTGAGGSGGGGGAGGHSVPIAFKGPEPKATAATLTPGAPGLAGEGGAPGAGAGNPGRAGLFGPQGKAQNTLNL